MKSIFLSHTSVDKPFVEKLAKDLQRLGLNVWFDKWSIQVGESITWKIENGIRENEFLGIILSPEALLSEWVKSELSSAWIKQMTLRKVIVLPILYRDCDIPLFLADWKYADFRKNYNDGLSSLASVFGIKQTDTISIDNWRLFSKKKDSDWKKYKNEEFETLITKLIDKAYEYKWSAYVGGTANAFAVTFFIRHNQHSAHVSFKLKNKANSYWACHKNTQNPNHLKAKDYQVFVGDSINACAEYLWRNMEDFKQSFGDPIHEPQYFVYRFSKKGEFEKVAAQFIKSFNWYKGEKNIKIM